MRPASVPPRSTDSNWSGTCAASARCRSPGRAARGSGSRWRRRSRPAGRRPASRRPRCRACRARCPTSSANATSGWTLNAEVCAPRRPDFLLHRRHREHRVGMRRALQALRRLRRERAADAVVPRLGQQQVGVRHHARTPSRARSGRRGGCRASSSRPSREVAPTSMYMSLISSTFLRSSSRSSCGGLEPTTPSTSPLRVLMISRCAEHDVAPPAAERQELDEAFLGDRLHHEADLVEVAGEHARAARRRRPSSRR